MASTNKTANLGLNQWVLTDPLLMEDMNKDNQKLDAAVGANPYVKLMDVTTAANAQQIDLDVSGIDFTKYAMVQIFAYNLRFTPLNAASYVYAKLNNAGATLQSDPAGAITEQAYIAYAQTTNGDITYPSFIKIELAEFPDTIPTVYWTSIRASGRWYRSGNKMAEFFGSRVLDAKISTLNFITDSSTAYIMSGARFLIYGVKK